MHWRGCIRLYTLKIKRRILLLHISFHDNQITFAFIYCTLSKEYWQLAMTRQNWKTQMSLKKPWSIKRNPKKATRLAKITAKTFSPTRRFLENTYVRQNIYSVHSLL